MTKQASPPPLTKETPPTNGERTIDSVFKLEARYAAWLSAVEYSDGELTPELEQELLDLEDDIKIKLENIAKLHRYAANMAGVAGSELVRVTAAKQKYEKLAERAKALAGILLKTLPEPKIKVGTFSLWIQNNGALSVVTPPDISAIPPEFRRKEVLEIPDKDAIVSVWESGGSLPQGIEVFRGTHVRIK